ncbi:hypothetical protein [Pantoea sp. 1.19]|uniref:hypothetical protein n=1 Tax=Pantoea sp. 1.19 TaxID=1925589 RepID=UPI000948C09E|nr:hypothetical protein [Pantoea sp. 1.19]
MRTLIIAGGLMMTASLCAGTLGGSITARLEITARCHIDGLHASAEHLPVVRCSHPGVLPPKITASLAVDPLTQQAQRWITVEW